MTDELSQHSPRALATSGVTGRFAPSPTGPLHVGSLVAAVGSWLFARQAKGRWLVRMEDLDTPRVVSGSADEILVALQRYGLAWDGEIEWQSRRLDLYERALSSLRADGLAYDCACSRAELQRAASAPVASEGDGERAYPGTCRDGLPPGRTARATRFRTSPGIVAFDDMIHGHIEEEVEMHTGDFVIKRADGLFAYQLAVVVDDAAQGVTQVVRGGDLLSSTPRQIALQRALGLPQPTYSHLPLVVNADGSKLGKRDGALPLPSLHPAHVRATLAIALRMLGIDDVRPAEPAVMLEEALTRFDPAAIPRAVWRIDELR